MAETTTYDPISTATESFLYALGAAGVAKLSGMDTDEALLIGAGVGAATYSDSFNPLDDFMTMFSGKPTAPTESTAQTTTTAPVPGATPTPGASSDMQQFLEYQRQKDDAARADAAKASRDQMYGTMGTGLLTGYMGAESAKEKLEAEKEAAALKREQDLADRAPYQQYVTADMRQEAAQRAATAARPAPLPTAAPPTRTAQMGVNGKWKTV
jgi:hypothetical protein